MSAIHSCPEHGTPDNDWPCLLARRSCEHLTNELQRRMRDVTRSGNYFQVLPRPNAAGYTMVQEYRSHRPWGEPKPLYRGR